LPLPSVTTLPLTPDPVGTFAAAGVPAFLKVIVLPLTVSVEPSWIREPRLAELVVRVAVTVALPAPVAGRETQRLERVGLADDREVGTGRGLQGDCAARDRGRGLAGVGRDGRRTGRDDGVLGAAGKVDGGQDVADRRGGVGCAGAEIDDRVAIAVACDVAADAVAARTVEVVGAAPALKVTVWPLTLITVPSVKAVLGPVVRPEVAPARPSP